MKQVRLNAKKQQTLSFAANLVSKNPFFTDLAEAFVCANFPFEKLQNPVFKAFLENNTAKSAPDECTARKSYLPSLSKNNLDIVKDNIGDAEYFVMVDEAIDGFSSTIASVFKSLPKKFHCAKKRNREDLWVFFIVQLGTEYQNTQRGNIKNPFATSKSFGKNVS